MRRLRTHRCLRLAVSNAGFALAHIKKEKSVTQTQTATTEMTEWPNEEKGGADIRTGSSAAVNKKDIHGKSSALRRRGRKEARGEMSVRTTQQDEATKMNQKESLQ